MKKLKIVKEVLVWPDFIRVFAIVGVVCIHSFLLPTLEIHNVSIEAFLTWFLFITAKTAVPLFLMLSGALLLGKTEPMKVFYTKRVRRLLLPWIFWSLIFVVVKHSTQITSLWFAVRTFTKVMSAEFSFLPALFCLYVLMPYFRVWVHQLNKIQRWGLISLWFIAISLLPFLRNSLAFPAVVDNGLVSQTVRYFGYLFLGFELKEMIQLYKLGSKQLLWIGVLVITLNCLTFWLLLTSSPSSQLSLSYVAPAVVVNSSLVFTLLLHYGTQFEAFVSKRSWKRRLLGELSAAIFGVFFCHSLVISLLSTLAGAPSTQTSLVRNIVFSLCAVGLSFAFVMGLRRVPKLGQVIS